MGTRKRGVQQVEEVEAAPKTSHDYLRQQLNADIEAYLASGGQIQQLDTSVHSQFADNDLEAW